MAEKPVFEVVPVGKLPRVADVLGDSAKHWFCLTRRGRPLKTPGGAFLAHPSRRLLAALKAEGENGGLRVKELSLYSMFCTMKDHTEPERAEKRSCKYLVLGGQSLRTCAGPEGMDQLAQLGPLEEFFETNHLPRLMLSQSGNGEHQEKNLKAEGLEAEMNTVVNFFDKLWPTLTPAQQCVVNNCVHLHDVFVLGILLAQSHCTPEQYANALLAVDCLIPGVFEVSASEARTAKKELTQEAALMLRFRDLAEG